MIKPNKFSWRWGNAPYQNDPKMTRQAAARMIRAWRSVSRQGGRPPIASAQRIGLHVFRVTHADGWTATMRVSGD